MGYHRRLLERTIEISYHRRLLERTNQIRPQKTKDKRDFPKSYSWHYGGKLKILDTLPKKMRKGWEPGSGGEPGKQVVEKIGRALKEGGKLGWAKWQRRR